MKKEFINGFYTSKTIRHCKLKGKKGTSNIIEGGPGTKYGYSIMRWLYTFNIKLCEICQYRTCCDSEYIPRLVSTKRNMKNHCREIQNEIHDGLDLYNEFYHSH